MSLLKKRDLTLFRAAAVGLSLPIVLFAAAMAQDCAGQCREAVKAWAMHRIALVQAAQGDIQGAKRTVSQIDQEGEPLPAEVTVVWFCDRQPIYEHLPMPADWPPIVGPQIGFAPVNNVDVAEGIPAEVPSGLPANYLTASERHGPLVAFNDEYDSRGTRVTARRYADGHVVIETPH